MIKNLTFGTDPEFFILNNRLGSVISSIPLIKGTKENPESLGDGFYLLADNVLAEGNVPPSRTVEEFIQTMDELKKRIQEYFNVKFPAFADNLQLLSDDCRRMDPMFLNHPDALQFGCSPYLNAWDDKEHKASDLSSSLYRTAGFHIHIGYDLDTRLWYKSVFNKLMAKAFDLFVTIPSYSVHFDVMRFVNYGGLGQYRNTSYGLECRSLGGAFTDSEYIPWVINQVVKMTEWVKIESNVYKLLHLSKPETRISNGLFTFDASVYEDLDLSYNEQLFKITNLTYAYSK